MRALRSTRERTAAPDELPAPVAITASKIPCVWLDTDRVAARCVCVARGALVQVAVLRLCALSSLACAPVELPGALAGTRNDSISARANADEHCVLRFVLLWV